VNYTIIDISVCAPYDTQTEKINQSIKSITINLITQNKTKYTYKFGINLTVLAYSQVKKLKIMFSNLGFELDSDWYSFHIQELEINHALVLNNLKQTVYHEALKLI